MGTVSHLLVTFTKQMCLNMLHVPPWRNAPCGLDIFIIKGQILIAIKEFANMIFNIKGQHCNILKANNNHTTSKILAT